MNTEPVPSCYVKYTQCFGNKIIREGILTEVRFQCYAGEMRNAEKIELHLENFNEPTTLKIVVRMRYTNASASAAPVSIPANTDMAFISEGNLSIRVEVVL